VRSSRLSCRRRVLPGREQPVPDRGRRRLRRGGGRRTLGTFAAAFSPGDLQRLDALFARGDRFAWFSSGSPGPRFSPDAGKRETLLRYFAARHVEHDRIRLVSYRFNGYEQQRVIGHFELTFARRADDYRDGEEFRSVGKGAVDCSTSPVRFMVLSLGGP
jgi:hypothetical protein